MKLHFQRLGVILGLLGVACTPMATPTLTPTLVPPTASVTAPAPTATPTATHTATPAPTDTPAPTLSPTPVMEVAVQADAAGKIYLEEMLLVDTAQEAPGCTKGQMVYAPDRTQFLLLLGCGNNDSVGQLVIAYVFAADGSQKQVVATAPEYLTGYYFYEERPFYQWAPDGRWLLYTRVYLGATTDGTGVTPVPGDNGLVLYDTQTGTKQFLPAAAELVKAMSFGIEVIYAPANNYFAVVSHEVEGVGEIVVYQADGSGETALTRRGNNLLQPNRKLAFAPNGTRLVYHAEPADHSGESAPTDLQRGLILYDAQTGRLTHWADVALYEYPLAWSPDSLWIAYLDQNETAPEGGIFVVSVDSTTPIFLAPAPKWSEDDAFTWVMPAAGGPPTLQYYSATTDETQEYSLTP